MVYTWLDKLKLAYNNNKLEEEVSKIGSAIEVESFKSFFEEKKEATES